MGRVLSSLRIRGCKMWDKGIPPRGGSARSEGHRVEKHPLIKPVPTGKLFGGLLSFKGSGSLSESIH